MAEAKYKLMLSEAEDTARDIRILQGRGLCLLKRALAFEHKESKASVQDRASNVSSFRI